MTWFESKREEKKSVVRSASYEVDRYFFSSCVCLCVIDNRFIRWAPKAQRANLDEVEAAVTQQIRTLKKATASPSQGFLKLILTQRTLPWKLVCAFNLRRLPNTDISCNFSLHRRKPQQHPAKRFLDLVLKSSFVPALTTYSASDFEYSVTLSTASAASSNLVPWMQQRFLVLVRGPQNSMSWRRRTKRRRVNYRRTR